MAEEIMVVKNWMAFTNLGFSHNSTYTIELIERQFFPYTAILR